MAKVFTEQEIVEVLTKSSRATYIKQKTEDLTKQGLVVPVFDPKPVVHDVERAENAVAELKKIGFTFPLSVG